jgi:methionyl-tRNA formyltransferase
VALRIIFCGTPAFAVPALGRLISEPDFEVAGVVTQPDRPRGRGQQLHSSPVKEAAVAAGIAVYQPEKIKSEEPFEYFRRLAPDAVVIIAYGQIISQRLIDIPRLGWINVHGSLLPKYRGAAPINWAIVNGEKRTGLTTMQIDAGLDTGPMLLKFETEIAEKETAPELTARLAAAGAPLIVETLRKLDRGAIAPSPQDNSRASVAPILKKDDGRVDWSVTAHKIYDRIRGLQPWPGAFTAFRGKNCQIGGQPLKPVSAGGTPGTILPTQEDGLLVICPASRTRPD